MCNEGLATEQGDDEEEEEVMKEFDFLEGEGEGAGEARSSGDGTEWGERARHTQKHTSSGFWTSKCR